MRQRSDEWYQARLHRITASRMGDVLAAPSTKRYQNYMNEIVDAFIGVPDFENDIDKPWFYHGIAWEDEARGRYEWIQGCDVAQVGIIVHPKYDYISCSPDGLVGNDGGIEIKCRKSLKSHLSAVRKGLPPEHKPQVQASLWITGRKWWDFISYYKNKETGTTNIHIYNVLPDDEYIKKLEKRCIEFWQQTRDMVDELF